MFATTATTATGNLNNIPPAHHVRNRAHLSAGSENRHCDCNRQKDEGQSGRSSSCISSSLTTKKVCSVQRRDMGQTMSLLRGAQAQEHCRSRRKRYDPKGVAVRPMRHGACALKLMLTFDHHRQVLVEAPTDIHALAIRLMVLHLQGNGKQGPVATCKPR